VLVDTSLPPSFTSMSLFQASQTSVCAVVHAPTLGMVVMVPVFAYTGSTPSGVPVRAVIQFALLWVRYCVTEEGLVAEYDNQLPVSSKVSTSVCCRLEMPVYGGVVGVRVPLWCCRTCCSRSYQ